MISFSTKAQTLAALEPVVQTCRVLPQVCFTVRSLDTDADVLADHVDATFADHTVIVRSSALSEDGTTESQAGKYLSVAHVRGREAFLQAARRVADAFADSCPENQIFVQPMLQDITMSGVVFTMDPNTGGNYLIVNYDRTGSFDSVTSGTGHHLQTYYAFRGLPLPDHDGQRELHQVLEMAKELMVLLGNDCLDLEFAFTREGTLYLLQARPLVMRVPPANLEEQTEILCRTVAFLKNAMQPQPYVLGRRSIYGVMPDWNPAEMIGIRPRPLALSLYRRLITDGVWAYQRNNYGYRNLRSCPLLWDFEGLPYIDTRVSFNSFIPKTIEPELAGRLADYYLDSLENQPDKHDKVEFDIIFSCFTFDLETRIQELLNHGFTQEDCRTLQEALLELTNHIIHIQDGLWVEDSRRVAVLEQRQRQIAEQHLDDLTMIYWLLEDCTRYGTLPFAGLARAGFIAVQLLQSLVRCGTLSQDDYDRYMGSLHTMSSTMTQDRQMCSEKAFLEKYGHLRPGTYDILAARYDTAPELYFSATDAQQPVEHATEPFKLSLEQYDAIQRDMQRQGLSGDVLSLFRFIKAGIEQRESSKFIFTRSVSMVLELLARVGADYGFTREDMSYFDINEINKLYSSVQDIGQVIGESVARGRQRHAQTLGLTMPAVILSPQDVLEFHLMDTMPNYITQESIRAPVCKDLADRTRMHGAILLLPAADPGYDWIFSARIAGFVTAYGGANSHMAIRAGELGIPAAIGVGEKLFGQLQSAGALQLDCANKRMEVIC